MKAAAQTRDVICPAVGNKSTLWYGIAEKEPLNDSPVPAEETI